MNIAAEDAFMTWASGTASVKIKPVAIAVLKVMLFAATVDSFVTIAICPFFVPAARIAAVTAPDGAVRFTTLPVAIV
jgi:hypothetical protein